MSSTKLSGLCSEQHRHQTLRIASSPKHCGLCSEQRRTLWVVSSAKHCKCTFTLHSLGALNSLRSDSLFYALNSLQDSDTLFTFMSLVSTVAFMLTEFGVNPPSLALLTIRRVRRCSQCVVRRCSQSVEFGAVHNPRAWRSGAAHNLQSLVLLCSLPRSLVLFY